MLTAGTRLGSHEVLALLGQGAWAWCAKPKTSSCAVFSQKIMGTPPVLDACSNSQVFLNHGIRPRLCHYWEGSGSVYPPCTFDWRFGRFWRNVEPIRSRTRSE